MTAPIRLLVVDDDATQIELVERALARDGFEVRGASTLDALRAAAASFAPELALVDINMPDVTSATAIAAVREVAPSARIVLFSAWEASKLRKLATELGADGYVSKSESVFEIGRRLRELR